METDLKLLESLRRGSESAWDDAFRRLYPVAFNAAQHPSAALPPAEAEDVAIETLTQLVDKVAEVKSFQELVALTAVMAARRAISERRKKYAEKRGGNQTTSLDHLREVAGDQVEPVACALNTLDTSDLVELMELLREALEPLGETARVLLHDHLLQGLAYKELAEKHQMPIGTVGVNIHRGLLQVRARLEQSPGLLKELRQFLR